MSLPLTWADKINSPLLADFIAKHGAEYCMTAEEINEMRDAINQMAVIQQSTYMGTAEPGNTPSGTGNRYWTAIMPGNYTNFGGVVVTVNSLAFISVTAGGEFSISQTEFDISGKLNVTDIIDNLTSTDVDKPLSAKQGKVLEDTKASKEELVMKADLVAGKNKFNYADPDILRGKFFEADGSIGIYSGFSISHPIDVVVGNSYTCNKHNGAFNCFFDANDVLIPFPILDNDTMTAPVGAVYLRYSLDLPDAADISLADIQVEEGLTSTTFEPYVVKLNPGQIDLTPYALENNTVSKIEALKLEALSLTLESDNLISKYHLNKWIDVTSVGDNIYDAIDDSDNVYGKVSEPVFINPEKEYSFWYGDIDHQESVVILELDNEKTILTRSSASSNTITPSSAQVVYLCLQYNQGYSGNIAIVEGLTFKNKGDYNPKLSVGGDRLSAVREVNQWLGKKVCTFGNSITQYGFWQDSVIKFFGFGTHYNRGVSSAKVSNIDPFYYWANADGSLHSWISENPTMPVGTHQVWSNYSSDTRIATIPLDSDLIIVMGGTNDAGGIAIGNMIYAGSSFDESVFKGGLAETIRKIQVRCPNAIIVVATPLSGLGSLPNYTSNGNGDTIADFALAVKDVAFRMSIPCIDIFGTCGINPQNRTEYLQVDNVHPTYGNVIADNNGTGSSMIARAMIGGLKNILPKDAMLTFITPPTL